MLSARLVLQARLTEPDLHDVRRVEEDLGDINIPVDADLTVNTLTPEILEEWRGSLGCETLRRERKGRTRIPAQTVLRQGELDGIPHRVVCPKSDQPE